MRTTNMIRTAKIGYIVFSAAIGAIGVMMLLRPDTAVGLLSDIIGSVLAAFGIIRLIGFYSRDLYRLAFQHDLALGILLIALGLSIALKPNWAMYTLCSVMGIEVIIDGLFKIQTALDARRFGLETWWLILAAAILAGVVGAGLIACPAAGARIMIRLLGASLIAQGLLDLCVALCAVKIIAHRQPV